MMTIAPQSISFLLSYEDGDQSYYEKTELHWDWPGLSSGPTIGAGYDCGYVTKEQCQADWTGILDEAMLGNVLAGVGLRGQAAHLFVQHAREDVTVTWQQAVREFTEREIPKQEKEASLALPNWDLLSPLCKGAIVSLGYNRGWDGFNSTLPRFREMHQIREYMADENWHNIPIAIAGMVRLWPNVHQLRQRRIGEAQMFTRGIPDNLKEA